MPTRCMRRVLAGAGGVLIILRMLSSRGTRSADRGRGRARVCLRCWKPSMKPTLTLAAALVREYRRALPAAGRGELPRPGDARGGARPARGSWRRGCRQTCRAWPKAVSTTSADAARLAAAGYDVALVGSALMQAGDPLSWRRRCWRRARCRRAAAHVAEDLRHDQRRCGGGGACGAGRCHRFRIFTVGAAAGTRAGGAAGARCARRVALVAVTLHPTQALVDEILRVFQPDVLQTDCRISTLLSSARSTLARLPVLRAGAGVRCAARTLPPSHAVRRRAQR